MRDYVVYCKRIRNNIFGLTGSFADHDNDMICKVKTWALFYPGPIILGATRHE